MLKIEGISKSYNKVKVLDNVDVEVSEGEILVLLGPSGGGKTTLLRIINGLTNCDDGTIIFDGNFICNNGKYPTKKELRLIRKEIGMVFQGFNLFPHMNVIENIIEAPMRVKNKSKEEAVTKAKEILRFLGLEEKESAYPCELSGGQMQRVAIGRALALEPKLLCFDEPTSALDPELSLEVAKLIKSLSSKGVAVLIITHDMDFAKNVSSRIVSMEYGKIIHRDIYSENEKISI